MYIFEEAAFYAVYQAFLCPQKLEKIIVLPMNPCFWPNERHFATYTYIFSRLSCTYPTAEA